MKSKYLLILVIIPLFSLSLFSQKYAPNYPHKSSGSLETHYSIIIGSMRVLENAEKLKETAILNGFECEVIPFNIKNKLFNRVCVGKYSTFNEANEKLKVVKKILKVSNAWILQLPSIKSTEKEQPSEMSKKAEEQKRRADSIAQAQEKIAAQKKLEKEQKTEIVEKKEEKKTPETNKIIKNEEPTSSKNAVIKSTLFSNDTVKKEFVATFKNFIEALRNYDYAKANQFIHPTFHLYVTYNIESLPSVREFNNFEKFFAVFSAFTSKGTSYDFSVDLENMIKKNNFKFDGMPTYNCEKHMYMPNGIIVSEINGSLSQLIEDTRKYYKSMNAEFLPVIEERLQNAQNSIQVAVVDSDNRFIESLYFGKIDNKWYLIVMDLKIKCK